MGNWGVGGWGGGGGVKVKTEADPNGLVKIKN